MNLEKSILILKPGFESNANINEHDSEPDALELFKRDARMHICKYKHEENRNNILRNRLIIRKQSKLNPYLDDIVRRYDDYYEEFKTKITMQIEALERLLKYLKNLESSKHKTYYYHHHHHHHHHHNVERDEHEDDEDEEHDENKEDDQEVKDEQGKNVKASLKKKVPSAIVAGIKKDQKLIFKEIRKLKNMLLMKGSKREAKYKELSKYIDKIDGETNKTDSNLFKIKREQEQILQTLGEITKDVNRMDKV
jgi:hypothetical protein